MGKNNNEPKILIFDLETAPILGYVWGLFDQNIALNQIKSDWHLLSFSAKWLDKKGIIYKDQRNVKNIEDDKGLLKELWKLLDEADIVITQNGKKFDKKKANARFILNGFPPPSSYEHIDTLVLAKKHFGFTSNKLEYMTSKLCKKYKKLTHKKFPGFELWKECIAGNIEAWKEMEKYNKHDVLSLEELYKIMRPWGIGIDLNKYRGETLNKCVCGSSDFSKNGYSFQKYGKFQRYSCKKCGAEAKDGVNLISDKKKELLKNHK